MKEYLIKDKEGVVIGRFKQREDRDKAFEKHIEYGFKCEEE